MLYSVYYRNTPTYNTPAYKIYHAAAWYITHDFISGRYKASEWETKSGVNLSRECARER